MPDVGRTPPGSGWRRTPEPAPAGAGHGAGAAGALTVLAVRPEGPGTIEPAPKRRHGRRLDRRPPTLRLPLASISRTSFLRLIASWLGAVLILLMVALLIRFLG